MMASRRAYAAVRAAATTANAGGEAVTRSTLAGFDNTFFGSANGIQLPQKRHKSTNDPSAPWKNPRVGGLDDRR